MRHPGAFIEEIEAIAWATPRPGLNVDALADRLKGLGHTVIEIDRPNNRIKIFHDIQRSQYGGHHYQ